MDGTLQALVNTAPGVGGGTLLSARAAVQIAGRGLCALTAVGSSWSAGRCSALTGCCAVRFWSGLGRPARWIVSQASCLSGDGLSQPHVAARGQWCRGAGAAGAQGPACRPDGWDRAGGSSALCRRSGRGVCDSRVNEGSAPLPGRPAWLICALVFAAADEERGGFSAAGERGSPRPEVLAAFGSQWAAPAALGSRLCSQSALGQAPFGPRRGSRAPWAVGMEVLGVARPDASSGC